MALRLHWSPDSANLVVRIALERLGLPFDAVRVDRARREQDGPAYRALNPQGLIPVLEDDGRAIFETGAILMHLADRGGRLGADGPAADDGDARAAFLSWLFFLSDTLHADLRVAFRPGRYVGPAEAPGLVAGAAARIAQHCALVEARLAEGGMAGGRPTMLEDYLACCLRWAQLYPVERPVLAGLSPWPRIAAMLARLEATGAVERAAAAERIPLPRPFTAPRPPDWPADEITG